MKPKCAKCRGLYQEKNESLKRPGVDFCKNCVSESHHLSEAQEFDNDYFEQIAMTEGAESLDCYWEKENSSLYGKREEKNGTV